jgi:hypothetical protein
LEKKVEREKQMLVNQQEEELEMIRVQIIFDVWKVSPAGPNSSEIYRKQMMAMQEHYEKQIQKLVSKN